MNHPSSAAAIRAVSADAMQLASDLMNYTLHYGAVRPDLPYTGAELRAAAALALSLGEPLAHFLEDAPED